MFNEKDKQSIEEELSSKKSITKEEEVQIKVSNKSKRKGNFTHRFKALKIKYKKDPKKFIVLASTTFVMLSVLIGSSYAYLSMTSKTNNSVVINAGSLALTLQNEENVISMEDVVPMTDQEGLAQKEEYSFDVKNRGSIPASFTIFLNNTCTVGREVDVCIPNDYVKVALKIGDEDYKILERDKKSQYVLDTGSLKQDESKSYKVKIWLDYDTPNTYNAKRRKTVAYKGRLALDYEQGKATKDESTVYRYSDAKTGIGDSIVNLKDVTTDYKKLNKTVFLQHIVGKENKIERNDICILNGNTVACVKGEQTENSKGKALHEEGYVSQYFEENSKILIKLFKESNCTTKSDRMTCSFKDYDATIYKNGAISATYDSASCTISSNGTSSCVK